MPLGVGVRGTKPHFINAATSNSIYVLGAAQNLEKGTMLLIVNLQFSDFLQFGNIAIWSHSVNGITTQSGHLLFLDKFEQTKIRDLRALPEIWKSRSSEILSFIVPESSEASRDFSGICRSSIWPRNCSCSSNTGFCS